MTHPDDTLVDAAVLVPVYRGPDGAVRLVLVRRAEGGVHGGQIAFPGGKRDARDASLLDTALREAREEISIDPASVELLAELPVVETHSTGFRISPFLGCVTPPARWQVDAREISEVLDVTAADLARPEVSGEEMRRFPQFPEPLLIRFYRVGAHKLWGATHRILAPLLPDLLDGRWRIR
ncbi:MAG: CoA pyrophosphatase [Candidatus Krumholzibacteria bacterium]|nr:CoA pyrophosphatase [Candidatus Krumholzibacteria bacterium]